MTASRAVTHPEAGVVDNSWGLWTHAELDRAGVPRSTVRDRVRQGRWQRVLPGVFAAGELDALGRCRAVSRWRPDAVLSHRSAAALWGLGEHPDQVEATVDPAVRLRTPLWLQLHRRVLDPGAVTTGWGLRLVTPERALIDVLQVERGPAAEARVDAALAGAVGPWSLQRVRERDSGSWGVGATELQLRRWSGPVESEPERLLARALRRRRRTFETGTRVLAYRCDFLHRPSWTVVEVDGREFHVDPAAFVRDRVRQNALQRLGLLVLRYPAVTVLADPTGVAAEICAVVDERGRRHRPW